MAPCTDSYLSVVYVSRSLSHAVIAGIHCRGRAAAAGRPKAQIRPDLPSAAEPLPGRASRSSEGQAAGRLHSRSAVWAGSRFDQMRGKLDTIAPYLENLLGQLHPLGPPCLTTPPKQADVCCNATCTTCVAGAASSLG